jgi:hypothetical protein
MVQERIIKKKVYVPDTSPKAEFDSFRDAKAREIEDEIQEAIYGIDSNPEFECVVAEEETDFDPAYVETETDPPHPASVGAIKQIAIIQEGTSKKYSIYRRKEVKINGDRNQSEAESEKG